MTGPEEMIVGSQGGGLGQSINKPKHHFQSVKEEYRHGEEIGEIIK
jgi:hypothetical protein